MDFYHLGLTVRSIVASSTFYREVVGLVPSNHGAKEDTGGAPGSPSRRYRGVASAAGLVRLGASRRPGLRAFGVECCEAAGVGGDEERIDVFHAVLFVDVPRDRAAAGQYRRRKIELDDVLAIADAVAEDEVFVIVNIHKRLYSFWNFICNTGDNQTGIAVATQNNISNIFF